MNVYLPFTPRLPSAYQEVEYIQSSGTQWIDTGVIPTSNTKSQIKFRNLGVTGEVIYGVGVQSSGNTNYRFFNYNSKIYFDLNYPNRINGSTCAVNTDYEFEIGNFYVKNVGASSNLISGNYVSGYTGSISIKLNYSNWDGDISSNRWYYVKIWDGATQVRDFIPCYRKSDGVIGMYDLVNNQFYTNSGTGTFSKGNDVTMTELKNAYIGEVLTKSIDVRGKTLAQIQAEGWGFNNGVGSYTLDSNGISVSTNNAWANLYYNISLSNAHKITLRYTGYAGYGGGSGYGGGACLGIAPANTTPGIENMPGYLFGIYQSGSSSGGKGTNIRLNWDNILSTSLSNNVAGNIDETFIINLDTGALTYSINGPVTGTTSATLTSSQLAQIKQYGWICFFLQEWTANYLMRLYTAEFTVE